MAHRVFEQLKEINEGEDAELCQEMADSITKFALGEYNPHEIMEMWRAALDLPTLIMVFPCTPDHPLARSAMHAYAELSRDILASIDTDDFEILKNDWDEPVILVLDRKSESESEPESEPEPEPESEPTLILLPWLPEAALNDDVDAWCEWIENVNCLMVLNGVDDHDSIKQSKLVTKLRQMGMYSISVHDMETAGGIEFEPEPEPEPEPPALTPEQTFVKYLAETFKLGYGEKKNTISWLLSGLPLKSASEACTSVMRANVSTPKAPVHLDALLDDGRSVAKMKTREIRDVIQTMLNGNEAFLKEHNLPLAR